MSLLAKVQTGKVKPDTNLNLLFFFLFRVSFSFPSILSLTCQIYVKDLIKCQTKFISYFFLFPKSSLHSLMFTRFLLIFGPPSPFILFSTFFLLILTLFLSFSSSPLFPSIISIANFLSCFLSRLSLFFKFFFSSLECYNFGPVHSFRLAY